MRQYTIDDAKRLITDFSEEEEYLDSVPENLQNSERYEENCESYDNFEDLLDDLSSTIQELEEIYN